MAPLSGEGLMRLYFDRPAIRESSSRDMAGAVIVQPRHGSAVSRASTAPLGSSRQSTAIQDLGKLGRKKGILLQIALPSPSPISGGERKSAVKVPSGHHYVP